MNKFTGTREMELSEHLGIKIPIDPYVIPENIAQMIRDGRYETREGRLLTKVIEPGERILELGGGIGFISTIAGQHPNVESVLVFEANPKLIPAIALTHQKNSVRGVEVLNGVVLSKHSHSTVPFFVRKQFWGSSLERRGQEREEDAVQVKVYPLPDVLTEFSPTMIVLDIEGGEASLFDGSPLPGVNKIMMEIHQQHIGGEAVARIFSNLAKSGFHYDQDNSAGAVILFRSFQL